MKNAILILTFLSLSALMQAQPHCFLVGPSYSTGHSEIKNYSFTRTTEYAADGTPSNSFTNLGDADASAKSVGIFMDIYGKKSRWAFDLMYPLGGSYTNGFNFNMAFGGYVKEKVGILFGASYYANTKVYNATPANGAFTELSNIDVITSGNFYHTGVMGNALGANMLLTYALEENIVFRIDYGFYVGGMFSSKVDDALPEGFEDKAKGRKLEIGGVWQISDMFGVALKFVNWSSMVDFTGEVKYNQTTPSGPVEQTVELNMFPERSIKSNTLTISIMIPLGSAESQSGTIDIAR
jgi:hypothetical protein